MNIDEYRKLSQVEKDEWLFKMVLGFQQTLDKQTESMKLRVSSLETKMDTQVEEVRADVQEVNKSVEGLAGLIGGLEESTTDLEATLVNVAASNAEYKEEEVTLNPLPESYMPGTAVDAVAASKAEVKDEEVTLNLPYDYMPGIKVIYERVMPLETQVGLTTQLRLEGGEIVDQVTVMWVEDTNIMSRMSREENVLPWTCIMLVEDTMIISCTLKDITSCLVKVTMQVLDANIMFSEGNVPPWTCIRLVENTIVKDMMFRDGKVPSWTCISKDRREHDGD
jgi:hypothetical protein